MPIILKGGGVGAIQITLKGINAVVKVIKQEENPYKLGAKFNMSWTVS
jgi:hypothetical protein